MSKKKLSFFSGSSMMACTMMGAGMLQLPSAVGSLGSGGLALGIMFVVLLITLVSLYFLMESLRAFALRKQNEQAINLETGEQVERSLENYTYSDLSTTIHEKYGPFVANLCFILGGYGTTLVYVSIIMNSVMQIITQIYGQTISYLRLYVSFVLCFLLFLLLMKRNMRFLSKLSYAMAFSVLLLTSFLVSLYGIFGKELGTQTYPPLNLSYFGRFFSIILFAFGCQQNSIEMATTLKDFTVKKAMAAITFASLCVYTLYSIVGWLGYQLFGSFEGDFISNLIKKGKDSFFEKYTTQSIDQNGAALYFFNILFCLILACAVPIQGRCSREGVLKFLGSYSEKTWVYVLATLGHVLLMFVICVFDFKAGAIMSQIGIFVMPMICFILPALIYKSSDNKRWKSVVAICTCLLSVAYMIYCTAQNVQDFIYDQSTVNVTTIGEVN